MTEPVARTLELTETAPLSEQLVRAVAEREGVDPVDLETPLYEAIDPDALDRLFRSTDSTDRTGGRIEFPYYGYRVVVQFDEEPEVWLDELDAESRRGLNDEPPGGGVHYCLDCGWRAAARDGYSPGYRSRMAIEHYVETGHVIDSSRADDGEQETG